MSLRDMVKAYVHAHPDEAVLHIGRQSRPETIAGLSLTEIDQTERGLLRNSNRDVKTILRSAEEENLLIDALVRDLAIKIWRAHLLWESFGYHLVECNSEVGFRMVKISRS